jgi:flagellar biosynthetic protein FliP
VKALLVVALLLLPWPEALAETAIPALTLEPGAEGGGTYSVSLQILAVMTALTLIPAVLLMMTAFTRIVIVLAILRQALGTLQTPSNHVLLGLALFLTLFVMAPVLEQIRVSALEPYVAGELDFGAAIGEAEGPLREFMLHQTREADLAMFAEIGRAGELETPQAVPLMVLVPAFVTSELKTAFQIGFLLFIPFLIIDLVVASVLMAMGMMMLSPLIISFPFKLMLFVLVDGWALVMGTLAGSFY